MIDWTTVFATLTIMTALWLIEVVAEWWFVERKEGKHGESKNK